MDEKQQRGLGGLVTGRQKRIDFANELGIEPALGVSPAEGKIGGYIAIGHRFVLEKLDDLPPLHELTTGIRASAALDTQPYGRRRKQRFGLSEVRHPENPLGIEYLVRRT